LAAFRLLQRIERSVPCDELAFTTWKQEHPNGRILRPDPEFVSLKKYATADWEERIGKLPTVTPVKSNDPFPPREIILGVELNGASKAYPLAAVQKQKLILDRVGGTSFMVVLGEDQLSIRAFETILNGQKLDFFSRTEHSPMRFVDSSTASEWNFEGEAVSGPLKSKRLKKVPLLKDYWFDWRIYHPNTSVYILDGPN
jgi:Protein of unknown function (DUF3179)